MVDPKGWGEEAMTLWKQPWWEQQPGEPDDAYEGFVLFASIPREVRSLKTARKLASQRGQRSLAAKMEAWAGPWRWEDRARAWDAHRMRQVESTWIQRELAVREEAWDLLSRALAKAREALDALDAGAIKVDQLIRLIEASARLYAMIRPRAGMGPEEILKVLQALPPQARFQVIQLLRQGAGEEPPSAPPLLPPPPPPRPPEGGKGGGAPESRTGPTRWGR